MPLIHRALNLIPPKPVVYTIVTIGVAILTGYYLLARCAGKDEWGDP